MNNIEKNSYLLGPMFSSSCGRIQTINTRTSKAQTMLDGDNGGENEAGKG